MTTVDRLQEQLAEALVSLRERQAALTTEYQQTSDTIAALERHIQIAAGQDPAPALAAPAGPLSVAPAAAPAPAVPHSAGAGASSSAAGSRRAYPLEFKQEAVERARLVGTNKAAVQLGIGQPMLSRWVRETREGRLTGSADRRIATTKKAFAGLRALPELDADAVADEPTSSVERLTETLVKTKPVEACAVTAPRASIDLDRPLQGRTKTLAATTFERRPFNPDEARVAAYTDSYT